MTSHLSFSGDKKCYASHLSHVWEECDALAHENTKFFLTCDVFCHILPEKRHILAPPVQNFFEREEMWRFGWARDWNMFFSSRLRFVTYLGSVKRGLRPPLYPIPGSVPGNYGKCVCCFVLLNLYWGIVMVPRSFLTAGDLGWPDPYPSP